MNSPDILLLRVAITLLPSCTAGRYIIGALNFTDGQSVAALLFLIAACGLLSLFLVQPEEQAQDVDHDFFAHSQRNRLTLTMGWERVSRNGQVNRRVMMMAV